MFGKLQAPQKTSMVFSFKKMGIPRLEFCLEKVGNSKNCHKKKKKKKKEILIFCIKMVWNKNGNSQLLYQKGGKMIIIFGNSHLSLPLWLKKWLFFLTIPNKNCVWKFWDSHVFFRGWASNFWNSPLCLWLLFSCTLL